MHGITTPSFAHAVCADFPRAFRQTWICKILKRIIVLRQGTNYD